MQFTRISGIPIRLHWSFIVVFIGYIAWSLVSGGVVHACTVTVLLVALFGTVVLHELGHALAARRYGIPTAHITLYPFGGIAALRYMPTRPMEEFLIALAGPAVNLVLTVLFGIAYWVTNTWAFGGIAIINMVMALFNLLPAFPMDGGRALRAALALRMGWLDASSTAIHIGEHFAWMFIFLGLLTFQISLALVGGFLLIALTGERRRLTLLPTSPHDGPIQAPPPRTITCQNG